MITSAGIGRTPSIFISSTCYDLNQIRADLKLFIEQLGFDSILSEYNSFPIDPDLDTVDNCLRVVQERADILILIIGGRYGYETKNGKSITNLEYLSAKAKGIPIYVFVAKPILSILKLWKDNPNGNFNSVVDSPKLFEFVETLRGIDNIWVNGFENAQEIADTLRKQLAYLFYDSLCVRKRIKSSKLSPKLLRLRGEALKLVIEKPDAWEYRLFGKVFEDGLKEAYDIRRDLKYGIQFKPGKRFSDVHEILNWMITKFNALTRISSGLSSLINNALNEAVGALGEPGDADKIVYVAEKVVEAYRNTIEWTLDFKSVDVEDNWQELISRASNFSETIISDLEGYCDQYNRKLADTLKLLAEQDKTIEVDLILTLKAPDINGYMEELNRLKLYYGV